jgi:hypothetical protein
MRDTRPEGWVHTPDEAGLQSRTLRRSERAHRSRSARCRMSVRHRYRDRRKITRSASKDRRTLVPVARRHSLPSSLAGGIQETRFPVATRTVALMPRFADAATPRTGTRPAVQSSTSLLYEQATRSTDLTKRVSAERKRETRFRARPRRRRVSGAAVQKRFHRKARPPTKGTHVARREPG